MVFQQGILRQLRHARLRRVHRHYLTAIHHEQSVLDAAQCHRILARVAAKIDDGAAKPPGDAP